MKHLKSTKQCENCPWLKDSDPFSIPNYSIENHATLRNTITDNVPVPKQIEQMANEEPFRAMSCHAHSDTYCLGWVHNQIGTQGNNIRLRMELTMCDNANEIELAGEQHLTFDDTFPPQSL